MLLKIGTIAIPIEAASSFSQTYKWISPKQKYRMMDNSLKTQTLNAARKLSTTISGSGWIPEGLSSIENETTPISVECISPLGLVSVSNIITLPTDFRTDEGVYGFAVVGELTVRTTVTDITDLVVTLATVTGADYYTLNYLPKFNADISDLNMSHITDNVSNYSWSIVAEEV
jgi:hypothetical protein